MSLTKNQQNILAVLAEDPSHKWTAREMNPKVRKRGTKKTSTEVAVLAGVMRRMCTDRGLINMEVDENGNKVFWHRDESTKVPPPKKAPKKLPAGPDVPLPQMVLSMGLDSEIKAQALLYFACEHVKVDSAKALRAAFLAGQMAIGSPEALACNANVPAIKKKAPAAKKKAVPAKKGPILKKVHRMPHNLSYEKLCEKAQAHIAEHSLSYEELAQRCGLQSEYLRRILKGEAAGVPSDRLKVIYEGIFSEWE